MKRFEAVALATLKDIGEELGLSVATVSRALNGFPEVNARTRDRVQETADRLGYRPNRVAQRLVTGRSGMVGMILKVSTDLQPDQTFIDILTGLTAALGARDVDFVLAVDQDDDPVAAYRRMLERDMLDGFILNAPVPNDPRVAFLRSRGVPFAMHGTTGPGADYPFYDIDNRAVTTDAVQLLTALGHRRIALLNGAEHHAYAVDRRAGFAAAMALQGLPVPAGFMASRTPTEDYGYAEALAMLAGQRGAPPTAFVCASTLVAAGVMRAVADRGQSVPGDVSVIAHDDALPQLRAINFSPALTVTRAPLRDACAPLAQALLDRIDGADPARLQTRIHAGLIVRDSTGPVPTGGETPWPST